MGCLHSKCHSKISCAYKHQVYILVIILLDSFSINKGISILCTRIVEVSVKSFHEHLLGPAGIEVVGDELYAKVLHAVEDLGGLEGCVGVQVLEHTGDAVWLFLLLFQIAADAVDTLHVDGIVSGIRVVAHHEHLFSRLQVDILECLCRNPVAIVDDHTFHLFLAERLQQYFPDANGLFSSENQYVSILIFIKDMRNERRHHLVVAHDDIVARLQVVDMSLLVVVHPLLNAVGDDTDDDAVEHKGTKEEDNAAGYQHPSMHMGVVAAHIEVVQGIGVRHQIQRQQVLVEMLCIAELLPLRTRPRQHQVRQSQCHNKYGTENSKLPEQALRQQPVELEPQSSSILLFHLGRSALICSLILLCIFRMLFCVHPHS